MALTGGLSAVTTAIRSSSCQRSTVTRNLVSTDPRSGDRINPWLQEASQRAIESGDLVGFDKDMVGPKGYFCDISRTFHCGPAVPTRRQKEIYRMAYDEVQHDLALVRPGYPIGKSRPGGYNAVV
ncbi:MAG: M24 family metallopeptidase, partial [Woeseiaceae bacterium]